MLTRLRRLVKPLTEAIGRGLGRHGLSPNTLTLTGLALSLATPVTAYLINVWAGLTLVILSSIFDILDGAVAKTLGIVSKQGALLDSFSDRVADASYIITLKIAGVSWLPSMLFLATAFLVSYARARGEALGLRMEGVGIMERGDRLIAVVSALIAAGLGYTLISNIITWIAVALCMVTIIHRLTYIMLGISREG